MQQLLQIGNFREKGWSEPCVPAHTCVNRVTGFTATQI
jgi:hypothetical protein